MQNQNSKVQILSKLKYGIHLKIDEDNPFAPNDKNIAIPVPRDRHPEAVEKESLSQETPFNKL